MLAQAQKEAWGDLLQAHAKITRAIDRTLREEGLLPLDVYDVLLILEEAPEQRLRMKELGESVLFSPSGITRLVDRLEEQGFVQRSGCPGDRRATHVVLTPAGLAARESSWPRYSELIHQHFGGHMTREEAWTISRAFRRCLERQGE